jgi:hypothetical protein
MELLEHLNFSNKIINLNFFLDHSTYKQQRQYKILKLTLDKLRIRSRELKYRLCKEIKQDKINEYCKKIRILAFQRKKGLKLLREMREDFQ